MSDLANGIGVLHIRKIYVTRDNEIPHYYQIQGNMSEEDYEEYLEDINDFQNETPEQTETMIGVQLVLVGATVPKSLDSKLNQIIKVI